MIRRIVSGGQTGVDRAALDAALALGIDCGGWCPKGRRAQDGPIALLYPLRETEQTGYSRRTRLNVQDSDGTLILTVDKPAGGTALTVRYANELGRPWLIADPSAALDDGSVAVWLEQAAISTLNVAGPSEASHPGIYALAHGWLMALLGRHAMLHA